MTKEQVLYRAELADKAYSEAKDINFRSLGLDLVKWIEHKESVRISLHSTHRSLIALLKRNRKSKANQYSKTCA